MNTFVTGLFNPLVTIFVFREKGYLSDFSLAAVGVTPLIDNVIAVYKALCAIV
jgi:hypothetical protein